MKVKIDYYEIEIAASANGWTPTIMRVKSVDAVKKEIDKLPNPPFFVLIAALGKKIDHGNFLMWSSGNRALIALHEHREHIATSSSDEHTEQSDVTFYYSDGSEFVQAYGNTISYEDAIDALLYWLYTMERTKKLNWQ